MKKLDSRMKGYLYLSTLLFYHAHSAMECHLFYIIKQDYQFRVCAGGKSVCGSSSGKNKAPESFCLVCSARI